MPSPHSLMAFLFSASLCLPKLPLRTPYPSFSKALSSPALCSLKREFILRSASFYIISLIPWTPFALASLDSAPSKSILPGIANTKSWFQFFGDGFSIRIPPQFQDVMEPEDYNAGLSLYGDKAKSKTFAARFASLDGYEVLSVVTRAANSFKITFLEPKDITDLGSLKAAAKFFVPGLAVLYSARTLKVKEDQGFRTYYFYEFGTDNGQHVALVAAVNRGKAFVSGVTAPQSKWEDDGVNLRSAAISLKVF